MAIRQVFTCDGCGRFMLEDDQPIIVKLGSYRREFCRLCSAWAFGETASHLTGEQAGELMRGFEARRKVGATTAPPDRDDAMALLRRFKEWADLHHKYGRDAVLQAGSVLSDDLNALVTNTGKG